MPSGSICGLDRLQASSPDTSGQAVLKRKPSQAAPFADWLERNTDLVLKIMFVIAMLGFPVIGYLAGASLAG